MFLCSTLQTASTAALGLVAVSSGATVGIIEYSRTCPEFPVETMARVKISFEEGSESFPFDIMEGNGDWEELGKKITKVYNQISEGCSETYQRTLIDCSHEHFEFKICKLVFISR